MQAPKEDIGASRAEIIYGQSIRFPSEIFRLRQTSDLWHHPGTGQLIDCPTFFIRTHTVRPSLLPPYEGPLPMPVISRNVKTFKVNVNDTGKEICIDRLKLFWGVVELTNDFDESSELIDPDVTSNLKVPDKNLVTLADKSNVTSKLIFLNPVPIVTKHYYGRKVVPPKRFGFWHEVCLVLALSIVCIFLSGVRQPKRS